jgi:hypothetical protein
MLTFSEAICGFHSLLAISSIVELAQSVSFASTFKFHKKTLLMEI